MCREQGNIGWKPQPVVLPGVGRQAASECRSVCPSLHPPQPDSTLTLPRSPLALHPTPHGSSSSLLLATPHSIQASHPNPSQQASAMSSSQLHAPSPAPGSLPSQSQVAPNLDPCPRHPHLTSSAPETCSLSCNSNLYPSGHVFTHSPSFPCPDPVLRLPPCPLFISQSRFAGSCCPEGCYGTRALGRVQEGGTHCFHVRYPARPVLKQPGLQLTGKVLLQEVSDILSKIKT